MGREEERFADPLEQSQTASACRSRGLESQGIPGHVGRCPGESDGA